MYPSCPSSPASCTSSVPPSRYQSILWNGKIGTLVLHSKRMVFAGLSGISISVPWQLVESHNLPEDNPHVDLELGLRNGQTVRLAFSESTELTEVQEDIVQRLEDWHRATDTCSATISTQPTRQETEDIEMVISATTPDISAQAVPQVQIQPTEDHTDDIEHNIDSVLKELEQDIQLVNASVSYTNSITETDLESENLNLRESVTSLLSKVGEMEGQLAHQENQHKSVVMSLEHQFDRLRRDLLGSSISSNRAPAGLETAPSNDTTGGRADLESACHLSSIRVGDQQTVGELSTMFMSGLMEENPTDDVLRKDSPEPNNDDDNCEGPRARHLGGMQLPDMTRPKLFTVPESVDTEEGMNLIRRKLNFRKSSVTGQRAYAKTLPEDSYGFLMVTPVLSAPFLIGLLVFGIQITIFLLMSISIVEEKAFNNNFGIPPNVDPEVKVLQFIAIIIAVVTQDDLMKGIDLIRIRKSKSFLQAFPHSNIYKVFACVTARITEGCLGIVTSFLLIVTSETIYYLLLNFTALEFVTKLDEAFFVLSDFGFAGKTCEVGAKALKSTTYYVHTRIFRRRKMILFSAIALSMICGWSYIVHEQRHGEYLCGTIQVQFGDEMRPELATFSGLYDQVRNITDHGHTGSTQSQHVMYIDRLTRTAIFAYCNKGFWTFQYHQHGFTNEFDPCKNWVVRSADSDAYDITVLKTETWIVRNDLNREIFLKPFALMCHDCGYHNSCTGRGNCSDAVCECDEGFYGLMCQFETPCGKIAMDSRFPGFLGTREWSQEYYLFKINDEIVNSYDRPVFMHHLKDNTYDLMFFTGRRWGLAYSSELSYFPDTSNGTQAAKLLLAEYFEEGFSAHWANITLGFISEPMDLFTPIDSQSPVGLQWFSAVDQVEDQVEVQTPDLTSPVEARLLCAVCNEETNPCLYDGSCEAHGICKCLQGSSGVLCEQPPLGNGKCDPYLNTPQYDFDGGDCCGTTCLSGSDFSCGRDVTKFGYIGYQCLQQQSEEWQRVGNAPIVGEDESYVGSGVALSRQGNFLVVGMPGLDKVVVYDRNGGRWIQRGSAMAGVENSLFGLDVKLASGKYNLWNDPRFKAPYTVGVNAPAEGNGTVYVFKCVNDESGACMLLQRYEQYYVFDISDDGQKIALAEVPKFNGTESTSNQSKIHVYSLADNSEATAAHARQSYWLEDNSKGTAPHARDSEYQVIDPIYMEPPGRSNNNDTLLRYTVNYVSLSGDGETMAVQTQVSNQELYAGCEDDDDNDCGVVYYTYSVLGRGNKTAILSQQAAPINTWSRPIVVSADSNVVAFASLDCKEDEPIAHVFRYNGREWVKRRKLPGILGKCSENYKAFPTSLSLSADGGTIAIGYKGTVKVFDFNGIQWQQAADATPNPPWLGTKYASNVALSSNDASALAIGLPGTDVISTGWTEVIERVLPPPCGKSENYLHFSLTTDNNPKALAWSLHNNSTKKIMEYVDPGYYEYELATHLHTSCIPASKCTILTVYDTELRGFPGLNYPGRLDIFAGDKVVADNGFTGVAKRFYMGNECLKCRGGTGVFQMMLRTCEVVGWELVDHVGTPLFRHSPEVTTASALSALWNNDTTTKPTSCDIEVYWEDVCINWEQNCYVFYVFLAKNAYEDDGFLSSYNKDVETDYFLFWDGKQQHKEQVKKEGQTSYFVGNCKEPNL